MYSIKNPKVNTKKWIIDGRSDIRRRIKHIYKYFDIKNSNLQKIWKFIPLKKVLLVKSLQFIPTETASFINFIMKISSIKIITIVKNSSS